MNDWSLIIECGVVSCGDAGLVANSRIGCRWVGLGWFDTAIHMFIQ
ncbi:hypothetical protein [Neptunomonas antarctica]|nr:hypothetical protein [Neptunomonas antarctica]